MDGRAVVTEGWFERPDSYTAPQGQEPGAVFDTPEVQKMLLAERARCAKVARRMVEERDWRGSTVLLADAIAEAIEEG